MVPEPTPRRRPDAGWPFKVFERVVLSALALMMGIVVVITTIELGSLMVKDLLSHPSELLQTAELLDIFGFFLLILIGIELMETIRVFLRDDVIHVEVVLEVALIAVARKVIVLDLEKYSGLTVVAVGVLVIALAFAYFMERRTRRLAQQRSPREKEDQR